MILVALTFLTMDAIAGAAMMHSSYGPELRARFARYRPLNDWRR